MKNLMQANVIANNNVQHHRNNHQTVFQFSSIPECKPTRQGKERYTLLYMAMSAFRIDKTVYT